MTGRFDAVGFDLDSTLADTRHRRDQCPTVNPQSSWENYAAGCAKDEPIRGTIRAAQLYRRAGYHIFVVSRRHASAYADTVSWLGRYQVPYTGLALGVDKVQHLTHLESIGYTFHLFFDDWPEDAAAVEAFGIPVVCINPRYDDRPASP